jgi:mannose-6-phosphate isomerase-like protein (cupin superfamily)
MTGTARTVNESREVNESPEVSESRDRGLATRPETSRAWWFLGTLAVLRNPDGAPRCPAVIELTVPPGGSPPLHIHDDLDDNFLVLEGEVAVRCGDRKVLARPGTYVALPSGVEHTFRVAGTEPARLLLVHSDDAFLRFIEAIGTPAREMRLPPADAESLSRETLVRVAAENDVRIIGAPMSDDEARALAGGRPAQTAPVSARAS